MFLTLLLNQLRKISKIHFIQSFFIKRTQGKSSSNFWVNLLPSLYSYKPGIIGLAKRNGINYELDISDSLQNVVYSGFKPVPFLYDKAEKNVSLNNFSNVYLNNIALSKREETLFSNLPPNKTFGSNMMTTFSQKGVREVKTTTLDTFIKTNNVPKVDFIK